MSTDNNGWIPISEDVLPPRKYITHNGVTFPKSSMSEYVLVFTNYNLMYVAFYSFNTKTWSLPDDAATEDEKVTYWMHLPLSPTETPKTEPQY